MGNIADDELMIFFLIFPEKPKKIICMKYESLFSGKKNKKKKFKKSSAEIFTQQATL